MSPARRGNIAATLAFLAVAVLVVGTSVLLVHRRVESAPRVKEPPRVSASEALERFTPVLRPASLSGPDSAPSVAIVRDPASLLYFDDPASYERILERWRTALSELGVPASIVSPAQLATDRSRVLVVASSPCLSVATRQAIETAGARNRGLILTWLSGTRNSGCQSAGFGMLARLIDAGRADTLPAGTGSFVTLPAGGALALDVPAGSRIEVLAANHVALRHRSRDAYYSDYHMNPLASREQPMLDGALSHATVAGRRVVYWGFELMHVVDRPWERALTQLLVRNSVAYAAGIPLAAVESWPEGARAAAVLAQDVEDEFVNARHALDTLRHYQTPATFFLVSDLAVENAELTRDLASYGEIGTHSENHSRLGGATAAEQASRLRLTQQQLANLVGRPVTGLRPPEEQFDAVTIDAWQRAGGSYVFGANNGRSASPELVSVGGAPMVLMGRVTNDDYITVRRAGLRQPTLAQTHLASFEKVRELGGLFVLSYHSNMLARPITVAALGIVARALKADSTLWLTTTGNVARWWTHRHEVEVVARRTSPTTIDVTLTNPLTTPLLPSAIALTLPGGEQVIAVDGGTLLPAGQTQVARARVDKLAAGATHTLRFTTGSHEAPR